MAAIAQAEAQEQIVAFTLAGETYGVDIACIQEIIRLQEITPLPRSAPDMAGVINLRGRITPVLDLRVRLGLESCVAGSAPRIIVVESPYGAVGLIVDSVTGVLRLSAAQIEVPDDLVLSVEENQTRGVAHWQDTLIILLDIARILRREAA